jgi:hypothetical protein
MNSKNVSDDDRIEVEISSDDCATDLPPAEPIAVSSDSDKGGSSLPQTDIELSADELSIVTGAHNDALVEPAVANTTPQLVVSNEDPNANKEVVLLGDVNNEQEIYTADDEEETELDEEKKTREREEKERSRNNRNFHRKLMNVKNDVEKIQEIYGGDS